MAVQPGPGVALDLEDGRSEGRLEIRGIPCLETWRRWRGHESQRCVMALSACRLYLPDTIPARGSNTYLALRTHGPKAARESLRACQPTIEQWKSGDPDAIGFDVASFRVQPLDGDGLQLPFDAHAGEVLDQPSRRVVVDARPGPMPALGRVLRGSPGDPVHDGAHTQSASRFPQRTASRPSRP